MEYFKFTVKTTKKSNIYEQLKLINFSQNLIKKLRKKEGYILLNDKIAYTNSVVKNGDIIKTALNPESLSSVMQCNIPLNIVYEDEDVLVVNKPSNLPCIPTRSYLNNNLSSAIAYYFNSDKFVIRIINRLDKDTAGLVCVAKNHYISSKLYSNKIKKKYIALCKGSILHKTTINKKILTTQNELGYNNQKRVVDENGKDATTYIIPIKHYKNATLCEFKLKHGRTHQIRLHTSYIDHPLIGDSLYGEANEYISHTCLVCNEMEIKKPNKTIRLKIDLPKDIKDYMKSLEQTN